MFTALLMTASVTLPDVLDVAGVGACADDDPDGSVRPLVGGRHQAASRVVQNCCHRDAELGVPPAGEGKIFAGGLKIFECCWWYHLASEEARSCATSSPSTPGHVYPCSRGRSAIHCIKGGINNLVLNEWILKLDVTKGVYLGPGGEVS